MKAKSWEIFPQLLSETWPLEGREDFLDEIKKVCMKLYDEHPEGKGFSWAQRCKSWNSICATENVLATHLDPEINNRLLDSAYYFANSCRFIYPVRAVIRESWVNVIEPYGFGQEYHSHCGNNHFSGNLFVEVPPESGDFLFQNPVLQSGFPHMEINGSPMAESFGIFDPPPGCCIVFPSWLVHQVNHNRTDKKRITLSFNGHFERAD